MDNNLIEQVATKVASLSLEQQREALALIEAIGSRTRTSITPRSLRLKGATAGSGPKLTLEDLKEVRKEMWNQYLENEN